MSRVPLATAQNISALSSAGSAKTTVFFSPFQGSTSRHALVRTGASSRSNTLVHSILLSVDAEYAKLDTGEKERYVAEFLRSIQSVPTLPTFTSSKLREFSLVRDLLDWKDLDALQTCAEENASDSSECQRALEKEIIHALSKKKQLRDLPDDSLRKLKALAYKFVVRAIECAQENSPVRELEETSREFLDAIADYIDRDIYVIDGTTRVPNLTGVASSNIGGRESVICLRISDKCFESVGRIGRKRGNIERSFEQSDSLINRLRLFVSRPERVATEYPELATYLPDYRGVEKSSHSDDDSYECE